MTIIGTCYFVSEDKALRYYRPYGFKREDVKRKIAEGEITIGKPKLKVGERLLVIDKGTRYAIEEVGT